MHHVGFIILKYYDARLKKNIKYFHSNFFIRFQINQLFWNGPSVETIRSIQNAKSLDKLA
jgi:hypothetical protein